MDALDKRVIKGYEFRERIGEGGFGAVYRAFQPSIGREVAIKVILPNHANQPDFVRRFEVEAQYIARLEHPHIVPLYDYWRDPDGAFLVMRWLRGSLRASIERSAWSLENTARMLDQIAAALGTAHREGIVHRDIKPDNILLDEDDNAYLADFGIAKDVHIRDLTKTADGSFVGSPAYISPEQIRQSEITARTDLYSLGYVLYEMLTGHKPFKDATTASDYIERHLSSPLPMISIQDSRIPAAVDEVLQTATAKDPTHRYPSVQRFAAAFRAALPSRLPRIPSQPLADPLTEREFEVLRLMVDGLSNRQIAERLVLAGETVKWYVNKQIYSKLDVHSRPQAIERARSMGLLDSPSDRLPSPDSLNVAMHKVDQQTVRGELPVELADSDNPYKGLRAFQESDAADFYGRAALTERLLSRLSEGGDSERFLVLVGASGSGKSSAVRAGLIPALRKGALSTAPYPFIADLMPGSNPLEELEAALLRVAVQPMPGLLEQLRGDRRGLVRAVKRLLPNDNSTELVLMVDQFEETFTLVQDEAVRVHFIDNLLAAATDPRGRVRVILTLRADFYDRPLMYPRLAEMVRSHTEVITPLTAREMEQSIIAPAERLGLRLEPGLVATILKDVGEQPGTLPLLQFALTELFERREGITLTVDGYKATGGVLGALARRADEIYSGFDNELTVLARQMFLRLVTLGEGTEDTRRRALLAELTAIDADDGMGDAISAFADYRLLTLDRDPISHSPTVEIAHEALIREWGKLREWLADSREDIRIQRRLATAAAEWNSGRDRSYLAYGSRLTQFETWAIDTNMALTKEEREYLDASLADRTRSERIERERVAHEQKLEKRSRNVLRTLVIVLLAATLGAFGLTGIAIERSNAEQAARAAAERSSDEARSIALTIGSQQAISELEPDVALALALAANRIDDPPAAAQLGFFRAAHATWIRRRLTAHTSRVADTAFHPDGHRIITTGWDGRAILWDGEKGEPLHALDTEYRLWRSVFHADGETVAISTNAGRVLIWNWETGQTRELPVGAGDHVALTINRAGTILLTADAQGTLYVWDWDTFDLIRSFRVSEVDVRSADFNPDESLLVTAGRDGHVSVWDFTDETLLQSFTAQEDNAPWVFTAKFLPDGERILFGTTAPDPSLYLWAWRSNEMVWKLPMATDVQDIALSPDAQTFVSGMNGISANDSLVYLRDTESGSIIHTYYGHKQRVTGVDYSSDGTMLVSGSADGTAILFPVNWEGAISEIESPYFSYPVAFSPTEPVVAISELHEQGIVPATIHLIDLESGEVLQSLMGHRQNVITMAFSPDGRLLLSGDYAPDAEIRAIENQYVLVWDVQSGELLLTLDGHHGWPQTISFTPDSTIAAIGEGTGGRIHLWDLTTGSRIGLLEGHNDWVSHVLFSSDGRTLYSSSNDGMVLRWDIDTGETTLRFADPPRNINDLTMNSDETRLIGSSNDSLVRVWDTGSGALLNTLQGHTDSVFTVVSSPDDRTFVTGSLDGSAILWDASTGEMLRQYVVTDPGARGIDAVYGADGESVMTFDGYRFMTWDASLLPDDLQSWVSTNRYIPALTCEQRQLYGIASDSNACDER